MSGHDTAVLFFRIATIVTTICIRLSLLPDFWRMRKTKNTGDASVLPSVLLGTNCYMLIWYSYVIDDILPLLATSVLGVVTALILSIIFYRWTDDKRAVLKIYGFSIFLMALDTIYSVLALKGLTGQSHESISTTMGIITIITTIGLYAAPLATIKRVIQTKSSASMPFTMGVVNFVNSICWICYSALVDEMFVLAPNCAGVALGGTQLLLSFIYPARKPTEAQIVSVTIDDPRDPARASVRDREASISVVLHSPLQDGALSRKSSMADGGKSPVFVALRSPKA